DGDAQSRGYLNVTGGRIGHQYPEQCPAGRLQRGERPPQRHVPFVAEQCRVQRIGTRVDAIPGVRVAGPPTRRMAADAVALPAYRRGEPSAEAFGLADTVDLLDQLQPRRL